MSIGPHKTMFFRRTPDDGAGVTLQQRDRFELAAALDFAIALAEAVHEEHARAGMHLGLCPANIRILPGGAIELRSDTAMPLAYVSPEQTGRMNRRIDHRSDFYSLGVVLYEVFTGQLPFDSDNLMELVHGHIARKPPAPLAVNLELPSVVSDIILHLLAKNAEERYQSLDGLLADLRQCRRSLREIGAVGSFPIGRHDVGSRLQLPQKLYGREAEIGKLAGAFQRIADGAAELLLVSGYAGIGKSALVNEIQRAVVARRGFYVSGKFDQFRRSVPYSAINDALRDLMRQILTESEARIATWRERLQRAVGPNGALVIEAIPELEYIIGRQPAAPQVAGRNSYSYVMQSFIGAFARSEHPLVVFLDDLQWADAASLQLLANVMRGLEDPCLLLVGAYRGNEVGPADPLVLAIEDIGKSAPVSTIELAPLAEASVVDFVCDTVQRHGPEAMALAQLVHGKTGGNPFFVGQFLKTLHNEGLLQFSGGAWRWDLGQVEALGITDNVVDLLMRELRRLPAHTHRLLTLAACVGNRFDARTVATVSETAEADTVEALRPALEAGLLLRPEMAIGAPSAEPERQAYQFLHDRVQQAAHDGIPPSDRGAVHLKIGRLLLSNLSPAEQEDRIFDIVEQLDAGRALLTDEEERDRLARLNLRAARKARASAAFDMHRACAEIARELGASAVWAEKQAFMHELHMELVAAAFARADYAEMERLCTLVSDNASTPQEAIAAKDMLIRCYGAIYKPDKLLQTGIELVELSGIRMPAEVGPRHIQAARLRLALALRGRDPLTLADLPEATDPAFLLQLQATTAFLAYGLTYLAGSNVVLWVALEMIRKAVRHGISPYCAYACAVWGRTLSGRLGKPAEGYLFGKLSALIGGRKYLLGAVGIYHGIIRHRREHLKLSLQPLLDTYVKAMEVGDRAGAVVALQFSDAIRFQSGGRVDDALEHALKDLALYRKMDYPALLGVMVPWAMLFAELVGRPVDDLAQGRSLDDFVAARKQAADPWGVFYVRSIQCIGDYLFDRHEAALAHAAEAIAQPGFEYGTPSSAYVMFIHSLAELALCDSRPGGRLAALARVGRTQARFRSWARHAPMNYRHKWQLVEAECQRVRGRRQSARQLYALAIRGARENGFLNDEALANELAARFHLACGEELLARLHLEEAHARYEAWGGHAKALQLEDRYPRLLERIVAARRLALHGRIDAGAEQRVDIDTLVKVSQALSGEIQLGRLLERVMQLLVRNAGAQTGVLLIQKEGMLATQAVAQGEAIEVLLDTPAEHDTRFSLAVVNYVRRTGETVVLGDAARDPRFNLDPYIRRTQPKSVMCIPLRKQSELIGLLYLENNLAADAFTPGHAELLRMLSTQIAISLENAALYDELEQKIEARTVALRRKNDALNETLQSLRQAQKQLVESEKLASLGQLVAGVAHEINTPVGVSVTAASTLAEETARIAAAYRDGSMKRSDLEKFVENADTIGRLLLSNMERAATLIQSFKEVAIDQASKERRRFRLRSYIDEVLLNLSPALRKAGHRVEVDCAADVDVDSYPGALAQVLTNLVMNALLHAYPDGVTGTLSISVTLPDEDTVALRFADDGRGIPAEHLPRIFDPFFTTMRGRGGSGLGLNVIHNLVTGSLQGSIAVDSAPGQGSAFTVTFPRIAAAPSRGSGT